MSKKALLCVDNKNVNKPNYLLESENIQWNSKSKIRAYSSLFIDQKTYSKKVLYNNQMSKPMVRVVVNFS